MGAMSHDLSQYLHIESSVIHSPYSSCCSFVLGKEKERRSQHILLHLCVSVVYPQLAFITVYIVN
jgi:hypothetical protein